MATFLPAYIFISTDIVSSFLTVKLELSFIISILRKELASHLLSSGTHSLCGTEVGDCGNCPLLFPLCFVSCLWTSRRNLAEYCETGCSAIWAFGLIQLGRFLYFALFQLMVTSYCYTYFMVTDLCSTQ